MGKFLRSWTPAAQSRRVLGTRISRRKERWRNLSYKRGKIPRAARDFYGWRIRAGGRERALGYKESRRVRYEHAKNQERSFGAQNAPQDDRGINSSDDEHSELKERSFGAKGAPQDDSARLESSRAEDRLSRVSAYLWFRHSQQARATGRSASYLKMSPAAAHTRWRKGNWRKPASSSERYRKEKAGNSESRIESAGAPLGGQRETKTIP